MEGDLLSFFDAEGTDNATYGMWQLEQGENGTPHFQGFVVWKKKKSLRSTKMLCAWTQLAHWERMEGNVEQSEHYCSKPIEACECRLCVGPPVPIRLGGPWKVGNKVSQGTRTDIDLMYKMIREDGTSELDIARLCAKTHARYFRAMERYRDLETPDRDFQTYLVVYWGPSGTGKSSRAKFESSQDSYWLNKSKGSGSGAWFDGYNGQRTVVIDEFYGWLPRDTLQRFIDRFPMRCEFKGSSRKFTSKVVIITSNKRPEDWWPRIGLGAMKRRLAYPIGEVIYQGNDEFPTAESWVASEDYNNCYNVGV